MPVRSRSLDAERQTSRPKESRAANDHPASKPNPGLTHQLYGHSERVDADQSNGSKLIPALTQKALMPAARKLCTGQLVRDMLHQKSARTYDAIELRSKKSLPEFGTGDTPAAGASGY